MKRIGFFIIAACLSLVAVAQNSVVIHSTGALGSYTTGNSSNTIRTDNTIGVQTFVTRGYAVFDLALLPPTAVITSVSLHYNVAVVTIPMGGSGNQTRGYSGDLSAISVASTLYAAMGAAPLIYPTGPGYGGAGNQSFATAAGAENLVQTNLGGKISIIWSTLGPAVYTITGETGAGTTTGAHAPYIVVDYTCPDITSISATAPAVTPCPNLPFTLSGSATGSIAGFVWSGPFGFTSTMTNPTVITGLPASGLYSLTVTDINGCVAKTSVIVTVNPSPLTTISPVTATAFCVGGNAVLDAPGGVGNTCQWYEGGVVIPGATDATYTTSTTGNYQIEITDGNGCVGMTAAPTPTLELDGLTVNPSGPVLLCSGDNGTITVNTNTITTNLSFQWQKDGVDIPGSLSNSHVVSVSGVYRCVVTQTSALCTTTSAEVTVDVNDYPLPVVSQTGAMLSTSNVYATYQWYLNTVAIPGATNYSMVPSSTGSYRVRVTDANGCIAFSGGYAINAVTALVGQMSADQVNIYPNPAVSVLRVQAPSAVTTIISTIDGKVLMSGEGVTELNISTLSKGMYLVTVYDGQGTRVKVEKLTKQ